MIDIFDSKLFYISKIKFKNTLINFRFHKGSIIPNENQLKESSRMTDDTLSKPPLGHPTKSSSKIIRKKTPRYINEQEEQFYQEEQFKILQIQQNSSRMSMSSDLSLSNFRRMSNSTYDKENQGRVSKSPNFNALAQRSYLRSRQSNESKLEKHLELTGLEKTQFLFQYLYGMKGELRDHLFDHLFSIFIYTV